MGAGPAVLKLDQSRGYGKPLSHLFDKPILSPINLLYHFDDIGLSKITHIIGR